MNWYKIAQTTLGDIGEQYYSFSYPTPFSHITDLSVGINSSAMNFVLKKHGSVVTTLRTVYKEGVDEIVRVIEDKFNIPFTEDIINNNKILLVDINGPEASLIKGKSGFFTSTIGAGGNLVLPVRYDEDANIYYTIGLATAIHEVVHHFDHLTGVKYSLKNRFNFAFLNLIKKVIKRIKEYNPNVNVDFLEDIADMIYLGLEQEKIAQDTALKSFFSALIRAGIKIPDAKEFEDFLNNLESLNPNYRPMLLPIWYAFERVQSQHQSLEEDSNA